ncbi:Zinc finger MYM-type protein 1 [Frankliniella fusca]|uniref:Zinc finger MYM-type protein 1 n=1 Tax=Frankliniella fusca TaxID=407009 RepID=A0AAE1H8Z3_9NEOP|nr:Zinc finger MYM-type protein 1 [Frankliniella fusca]
MTAWLEESNEEDKAKGLGEAYCNLCHAHLRAHKKDLERHASRDKHVSRMQFLDRSQQRALDQLGVVAVVTDEAKRTDIRLAMFIAMHCSIKSVDHLGELLRTIGQIQKNSLANIRLHRTKCSKLISAVIAPAFLADLVADVGDSKYCIIADEATDCSTSKFMGLCIQYHSKTKKKMITDFLGLVQVVRITGVILADALKEYLAKIGLKMSNMRALGTDGANNMCGEHNSFYSHLKQEVPNLQLFKCVCHSVDKSAEYAHRAIPGSINFVLRESHNWFAHSTVRQEEYNAICKTLNGKEPGKVPKECDTRWLSWMPGVEYIVSHWTELRAFFTARAARADPKKEKTIIELAGHYKNPATQLYFLFLKSVLLDVNRVKMEFQQTNADITKLYSDLRILIFSLAGRFLKETAIPVVDQEGVVRMQEINALRQALNDKNMLLPLDRASFGASFALAASTSGLTPHELQPVRNACGQYV